MRRWLSRGLWRWTMLLWVAAGVGACWWASSRATRPAARSTHAAYAAAHPGPVPLRPGEIRGPSILEVDRAINGDHRPADWAEPAEARR